MIRIDSSDQDGSLKLTFGKVFDFTQVLSYVKSIPGARFIPDSKYWSVPASELRFIPSVVRLPRSKEVVAITADAYETCEKEYEKESSLDFIKESHEFDLGLNGRVKLSLRPYQTVGAKFLYEAGRAINGDTVGLGKTAQALAASQILFEKGEAEAFLFILPASLVGKWAHEVEKFTNAPYIFLDRKNLLKKNPVTRYVTKHLDGYYLLMSYDMTFRYSDRILNDLSSHPDFRLGTVLDEIQYVKNYRSKRSKATKQICNRCFCVYGLSATYLETSITDVHSIMEAINPSVFSMSGYAFRQRYANIGYWGEVRGYRRGGEIKRKLSPVVIRRHKEDVSDQLPERIQTNYWINLKSDHKEFYLEILEQVIDRIEDMRRREQVVAANALTMMGYLRQACLSPVLMGNHNDVDSKLETLLEILHQMEKKDKVVIFCYYKKMVELLASKLSKSGYKAMGIHAGNCPKNKRMETIEEFTQGNYKVLVSSDILREGHDVVVAPHLIHYDLLWNPASLEQRSGRIDRITQEASTIFISYIISRGTVEEYMFARMEEYKGMGHDIMDNMRKFKRVTMRDIDKVLQLKPK